MSLRSRMRDDFPPGWWRSARWWFSGTADLLFATLASVATVLFLSEVRRVVRHRDDPRVLMTLRATTEGYVAGFVVSCGFFVIMPQLVSAVTAEAPELTPPTLLIGILAFWFAANAVLSLIVLVTLLRSRLRDRSAWADRDFIDQHAPKYGRPPETIDEYRASVLRDQEQNREHE